MLVTTQGGRASVATPSSRPTTRIRPSTINGRPRTCTGPAFAWRPGASASTSRCTCRSTRQSPVLP